MAVGGQPTPDSRLVAEGDGLQAAAQGLRSHLALRPGGLIRQELLRLAFQVGRGGQPLVPHTAQVHGLLQGDRLPDEPGLPLHLRPGLQEQGPQQAPVDDGRRGLDQTATLFLAAQGEGQAEPLLVWQVLQLVGHAALLPGLAELGQSGAGGLLLAWPGLDLELVPGLLRLQDQAHLPAGEEGALLRWGAQVVQGDLRAGQGHRSLHVPLLQELQGLLEEQDLAFLGQLLGIRQLRGQGGHAVQDLESRLPVPPLLDLAQLHPQPLGQPAGQLLAPGSLLRAGQARQGLFHLRQHQGEVLRIHPAAAVHAAAAVEGGQARVQGRSLLRGRTPLLRRLEALLVGGQGLSVEALPHLLPGQGRSGDLPVEVAQASVASRAGIRLGCLLGGLDGLPDGRVQELEEHRLGRQGVFAQPLDGIGPQLPAVRRHLQPALRRGLAGDPHRHPPAVHRLGPAAQLVDGVADGGQEGRLQAELVAQGQVAAGVRREGQLTRPLPPVRAGLEGQGLAVHGEADVGGQGSAGEVRGRPHHQGQGDALHAGIVQAVLGLDRDLQPAVFRSQVQLRDVGEELHLAAVPGEEEQVSGIRGQGLGSRSRRPGCLQPSAASQAQAPEEDQGREKPPEEAKESL